MGVGSQSWCDGSIIDSLAVISLACSKSQFSTVHITPMNPNTDAAVITSQAGSLSVGCIPCWELAREGNWMINWWLMIVHMGRPLAWTPTCYEVFPRDRESTAWSTDSFSLSVLLDAGRSMLSSHSPNIVGLWGLFGQSVVSIGWKTEMKPEVRFLHSGLVLELRAKL